MSARDVSLARDTVFIFYFSGDTANDLGNIKTQEILAFLSRRRPFSSTTCGEILRVGFSNLFIVHQNLSLCPAMPSETYVAVCTGSELDLPMVTFSVHYTPGAAITSPSQWRKPATHSYYFKPANVLYPGVPA